MKIIFLAALAVCVTGQTTPDCIRTTTAADTTALLNELRKIFLLMDSDDDGGLTLNELFAYFDSIDPDHDGSMTYAEFEASRVAAGTAAPQTSPERDRATFTYYDTLGGSQTADGVLKRDDMRYFFNLLDDNNDGVTSLREFDESFVAVAEAISKFMASTGC